MKPGFFIFLLITFCAGVFAQTPQAEPKSVDVYLAKDDGKGNPGQTATEFVTTDSLIHCVVKLGSTSQVTVKMFLVAVNVLGVKRDSRVVSASYTTAEGENEVFFNGKPHKNWVSGTYRAEILVDGKPFRSLDFVIKPPAAQKENSFAPKATGVKPRRPKAKAGSN